jgi:hypothetical protein
VIPLTYKRVTPAYGRGAYHVAAIGETKKEKINKSKNKNKNKEK